MNLRQNYWVKKFLYPFALDPTPLKLHEYPLVGTQVPMNIEAAPKPGVDDFNQLMNEKFHFPMSHIDHKEEYWEDILNPITIQQDEIMKDMY